MGLVRAVIGARAHGTAALAKRSPLGLRGMTHLKNNEAPVICRGYVADASHVS
jgi:hypothetical protein